MKFTSLFLVLLFVSCSKRNCNDINSDFNSYNNAIEVVQNSSFAIEEKVETDYFFPLKRNKFLKL